MVRGIGMPCGEGILLVAAVLYSVVSSCAPPVEPYRWTPQSQALYSVRDPDQDKVVDMPSNMPTDSRGSSRCKTNHSGGCEEVCEAYSGEAKRSCREPAERDAPAERPESKAGIGDSIGLHGDHEEALEGHARWGQDR